MRNYQKRHAEYAKQLMTYLCSENPMLLSKEFVIDRSRAATEAYYNEVRTGNSIGASEIANATLMEGLHRTQYSLLYSILEEILSIDIEQAKLQGYTVMALEYEPIMKMLEEHPHYFEDSYIEDYDFDEFKVLLTTTLKEYVNTHTITLVPKNKKKAPHGV